MRKRLVFVLKGLKEYLWGHVTTNASRLIDLMPSLFVCECGCEGPNLII